MLAADVGSLLSTSTVNFRALMANGRRYEVPDYQRDYSWTREQWEDLWADLVDLAREPGRQHYMGALVLQEPAADLFRIIDGQQRIVTLSVLVAAALRCLQRLVEAEVQPDENKQRMELLRGAFLGGVDPISLHTIAKLRLNEANRAFFEGTLLRLKKPISRSALRSAERPLWEAFEFFRKKLDERYVAGQDGAEIARFIYEVVAVQLLFIVVSVEDEQGAYTVFETLNARGLELSAGDLLKNFLFSVVHRSGAGHLDLAQRRWRALAERVPARDLPGFLRSYLNSRRPLVRQNRVYKTIREEVTEPGQVFELLDHLEPLAELSEALDDHHHPFWQDFPPPARDHVRHLNLYRVTQFRPLLFAAWLPFDREQLVKLLRLIDVLSLRYSVIGQENPNALEDHYNRVAQAIHRGEVTRAGEVREALRAIYVEDEDFKAAFSRAQIPASGERGRLVRYLLCAIEGARSGGAVQLQDETTTATIEHVLPKNPSEAWSSSFTAEQADRYVDRLGNYLLLEGKLNAREAANRSFGEKREIYWKSGYPSTRELAVEEWTPAQVEQRQAEMARLAVGLWRWT
jgi:hypothetical protein